MYIVLWDNICRHQVGSFDLWCHLILGFLCWFFCLDNLTIDDRGVLKCPTTTVLESICDFKSFIVCLMKLGALSLGTYRLIIVISFWCISPFIGMKCPLFCLTNVSFKSTLSDTSNCYSCLLSGVIGLVNFLPGFYPKPVLVSVNEMGLL
jgi:hypothetical protein